MIRLLGLSLAALAVALSWTAGAEAGLNASGSGSGYSHAKTLAAGSTPTASVSGRNVTVSWSAPSGVPASGYVVKRYDTSNQLQTIGASCTGTIAGLSCTENAVPSGTWKYTVTPRQSNWTGTESAKSATTTVGAAALSLSPATVTSLPSTPTGQITNFVQAQTVTFRLDNPSTGTVLTGSITPTPVPSNGTSSVSVTLPAGTANGAHTVYAVGSLGDQAGAPVTVNRPQIGTSVIAKNSGGVAGQIKAGGNYFVYANATGSGNPPTGLSTLQANVSTITTGQTALALTAGSYTAGGQSYNYRSAQQTANAGLTAGSKSYTLTLTDTAGSQTQSSFTVNVDNTVPTATDIQTQNNNTTVGLPQITDTITRTFSEPIDPESVLAGWNGSATPVVVHLVNALILVGGNDGTQVFDATDAAQLPLGQIDLGRTDYVTGVLGGEIARFGATGTASSMQMTGSTIVITLGTQSGQAVGTAAGNGRMSWTPSTTPYDWAGNQMTATAVNESGANDKDF
jgi:hypothetical protein